MNLIFKHKRLHFAVLTIVAIISFSEVLAQVNADKPQSFAWRVESFYKYRKDGKPGRVISLLLKESLLNAPVSVKVVCDSVTETTIINDIDSLNQLSILLPVGAGIDKATIANVSLMVAGKELSATIPVPAERLWTVYIYPHSHVDIGYTGLQEDVEKIHVRNIDVGIDLAKKTQNYPEGSRFIWNTEATWVVDAYLKKANQKQRQSFFDAVKKGWVRVDAGYANVDNTTCSDEELMQFFKTSNAIEKQTGVPISTMVQVDLPGAAWGLVTAAVQNGVTGFLSFPNNYDLRKIFEHKPFYWKGPDGKSKILFLQGYPYGIGYTIKGSKYGLSTLQTFSDKYDRVSTGKPLQNFIDGFLFKETARLENEKSPYNFFVMTWSMADNCVIDADLPEAVKQWNTTYAYPKLIIAGAKEILTAYETKYGSIIPEYSGDFTEFWTEGLGSDAVHVGMGRHAKENLVQLETLSALVNNTKVSSTQIDDAWENVLLSAEHTWGYQNPAEPLAKVIEKRKAAFFSDAEKQSIELLKTFGDTSIAGQFAIVNTLSWSRGGIITLNAGQSKAGDRVIDVSSGKEVLSQRLSTGELIFKSNPIPAFSSCMYKVVRGTVSKKALFISADLLENESLSISIDAVSGNIHSVIDKRSMYEYVSNNSLNSYHYVEGVFNGRDHALDPVGIDSVTITVKEKGPLLVSLLIRSKAPGTNWLQREVKLFSDERFVQIKNTFDKIATRKKEGIHFGFDFNLPQAVARMDAPWSVIIPEQNQLKGANRNWMTFQRWIDLSNNTNGVTWTAIESPLVEWGEVSGTILDGAQQFFRWKKKLAPTQTLYSWPVNNHWNTNFPLEQSGIIVQQYAVFFHGQYDPISANHFGMEQHRPLLVIPAKYNLIEKPLFEIDNPRVVVSGLKKAENGKGVLVRVRSFSEQSETIKFTWPAEYPLPQLEYDLKSGAIKPLGNQITILPYSTKTFYLDFKEKPKIFKKKEEGFGNDTKSM